MFPSPSRRAFLQHAASGVGSLAFAALCAHGSSRSALSAPQDPAVQELRHHAAKAKRVIWLYMDGGISHIDTFDPKPKLAELHGMPFPLTIEATQFDSNGPCLQSPWKTSQHGQSGLWISELFPELARHADDLCVLRSMTNEAAIHATANYWMHTGWGQMGRPSVGAWVHYALGSEADNLPGFVVLNAGLLPIGGIDNYKSGFLPASNGPTVFERTDPAVPNLTPANADRQAQQLAAIDALDRAFSERLGKPDPVETGIKNYELAAKLQVGVPDLLDLSEETAQTQAMYGLDHRYEHTRTYARQCLLARRMVERGVRFVSLTVPRVNNDTRWDAHGGLKQNHDDHARMVDQPIAALLTDLKQRGLWDDVLVVFTTEFGRTPFSQGTDGRDHNQFGFSVWLAGGGVKGGMTYGTTDEFGYKAIENKLVIHDFHATILHFLGLDHEQLTYRFGGRDYRLTDVHGRVVKEILA
jgi:hypothetical protein